MSFYYWFLDQKVDVLEEESRIKQARRGGFLNTARVEAAVATISKYVLGSGVLHLMIECPLNSTRRVLRSRALLALLHASLLAAALSGALLCAALSLQLSGNLDWTYAGGALLTWELSAVGIGLICRWRGAHSWHSWPPLLRGACMLCFEMLCVLRLDGLLYKYPLIVTWAPLLLWLAASFFDLAFKQSAVCMVTAAGPSEEDLRAASVLRWQGLHRGSFVARLWSWWLSKAVFVGLLILGEYREPERRWDWFLGAVPLYAAALVELIVRFVEATAFLPGVRRCCHEEDEPASLSDAQRLDASTLLGLWSVLVFLMLVFITLLGQKLEQSRPNADVELFPALQWWMVFCPLWILCAVQSLLSFFCLLCLLWLRRVEAELYSPGDEVHAYPPVGDAASERRAQSQSHYSSARFRTITVSSLPAAINETEPGSKEPSSAPGSLTGSFFDETLSLRSEDDSEADDIAADAI